MRQCFLLLSLLLMPLLLEGCSGYRVQSCGGMRMQVNMFANRSYFPAAEGIVTDALVHEFLRGGCSTGDGESPYVLEGTVADYTTRSVAFSRQDRVAQVAGTLTVEAVLKERSGRVVWRKRLAETVEYPADADLALQRYRQEEGVREAARRIARRIVAEGKGDF